MAFALTEMAVNDRLSSIAFVFLISYPCVQCRQQQSKTDNRWGTLMRYFFSLTRPESALSIRIIVPATAS